MGQNHRFVRMEFRKKLGAAWGFEESVGDLRRLTYYTKVNQKIIEDAYKSNLPDIEIDHIELDGKQKGKISKHLITFKEGVTNIELGARYSLIYPYYLYQM